MKEISSYEEFSNIDSNEDCKLVSDIDCEPINEKEGLIFKSPVGHDPIGTKDEPYNGEFYGNGYTIHNIDAVNGDERVGVFGCLGEDGLLANLTIENISVTGEKYVGGLVGYSKGEINNCTVRNVEVEGESNVGGLAGYMGDGYYNKGVTDSYHLAIMSCVSDSRVVGDGAVGGFAGQIDMHKPKDRKVVNGCSSDGIVKVGDDAGIGGFVGVNDSYATIVNCYTTVTFEGNVEKACGFAGRNGSLSGAYTGVNEVELFPQGYDMSHTMNLPSPRGVYPEGMITNCFAATNAGRAGFTYEKSPVFRNIYDEELMTADDGIDNEKYSDMVLGFESEQMMGDNDKIGFIKLDEIAQTREDDYPIHPNLV